MVWIVNWQVAVAAPAPRVQTPARSDPFRVLLDVEMPELDGIGATRAIRTAGHAGLPVVALTGHAEESVRQQCLEAGMSGFLEKPINPTVLVELLGTICRA